MRNSRRDRFGSSKARALDVAMVERLGELQRIKVRTARAFGHPPMGGSRSAIGAWPSSIGRRVPSRCRTKRSLDVSFNGEIYNYRALRHELEQLGCVFLTNSDTEVLVNAVARWGEAGLRKLRGMYAFALWDQLEHELWLARDPYGIKPLYVAQRDGILWFASQARALARVAPVDCGARRRRLLASIFGGTCRSLSPGGLAFGRFRPVTCSGCALTRRRSAQAFADSARGICRCQGGGVRAWRTCVICLEIRCATTWWLMCRWAYSSRPELIQCRCRTRSRNTAPDCGP